MSTPIDLSICTLEFETEEHYEFPRRLLHVTAKLTHPTLGELASASCLQIKGRAWFKDAADFLEVMDVDSDEWHEFSTLFDKGAVIRPELVDGGRRSGSGCWGKELNEGEMLYINDVRVKEEFRQCGVGSCVLEKLLASSYLGQQDHAYCWPSPIFSRSENMTQAERTKNFDNVVAFFRKNGFRRIGLTQFFAYSPNPSHPSRQLAASADADQPTSKKSTSNLTPAEILAKYALHTAVATNKGPSITAVLRAAFQADPTCIHEKDIHNYTPMHIAAAERNVLAVRTLLELDFEGIRADLEDGENDDSVTPLEGLQSTMRSSREFSETLLGKWDGHGNDALACEYMLMKAMGMEVPFGARSEEEYIKKKKFGCTCGACTDGWLSPRMRYRLSEQAAEQVDLFRMDLELRQMGINHSSRYVPSIYSYLPPHLEKENNRTFITGFLTIFRAMHDVLASPERYSADAITPKVILARAFELDFIAAKHYIAKGAKVEHALDALLGGAEDQSPRGDGT
ncbi:hypothetical protein CVT26_014688, partial [Gymnopilus dilepis]